MKETQLSRINDFIEQLSSAQSHSDGVLLLDGEMEQVGAEKRRKLARNSGNCTNDTIGKCDINSGDCTNTGIACMYCTNNGDCTNTQSSSL